MIKIGENMILSNDFQCVIKNTSNKIINITKRPQTNVILIVTKNIKVYF